MSARRCPRLLAAVVPVVCLGAIVQAAEPDRRNSSSLRSQSRSAEISAAVRAKLPKYQPNPPQNDVTMSESGKGAVEKDGVLNLPAVIVRGRKPQEFDEYEIRTPKGRLELALKRRPGLRIGNLFGMNNGIALALLQEDIEKGKRDALKEQVERLTFDDSAETRELKRVLKGALARPNTDWMKGR